MRRREFITLICGAAAWPLGARAQPRPVVGFLHSGSADPRSSFQPAVAAFRHCLADGGFREDDDVAIMFRWAENRFDKLPMLARDLVAQNVSLIFAGGGDVTALAAKAATATIPIVFAIGADPVKQGIVTSYNRPVGNVTGATFLSVELRPKTLELIRELLPQAKTVGIMANPNRPNSEQLLREVVEPARALGLRVRVLKAGSEDEIDAAFGTLREAPVGAIVVLSDPVFFNLRDQFARLELQHRTPTIHGSRGNVLAGSLMSYGASIEEAYCHAGSYAARILRGERPGDLPVLRPTKLQLVFNLKTAKRLGLEIPPALLARADEVIE